MSSRPKIQLKSIKYSTGLHHNKVCADLFVCGKKVGEILDDGWCDEIYIEFLNENLRLKFNKKLQEVFEEENISPKSPGLFIKELIYSDKIKKFKNSDKELNKKGKQISFL